MSQAATNEVPAPQEPNVYRRRRPTVGAPWERNVSSDKIKNSSIMPLLRSAAVRLISPSINIVSLRDGRI